MADDFGSAKDLYKWNEHVLVLLGVWPLRSTYVTFVVWVVYLLNQIVMECRDLYHSFGDLDLLVANLSESTLEVMELVKLLVLRLSGRLMRLMQRIMDDLDPDHYDSPGERDAYLSYNRTAKTLFKIWVTNGILSSVAYHSMPLEFRIKSVFRNDSLPFVLPYRTRLYFDVNDSTTFWIVWICQSPMIMINMFHSASIGYLISLVLHICGQLSVLVFRIKNLPLDSADDTEVTRNIFRNIVTKHRRILDMAEDVKAIFQYVLLEELFINTVIVGITCYICLVNVDAEEKGVFISCTLYGGAVLFLIYGYCIAGEYLINESTNLYNAYYECQWYTVSDSFKKQMIICMLGAKKPIQLTGGGYYVFSLDSFTGVLKTTAGYISMLRNLV